METSIYSFYRQLDDNEVILMYEGEFSQETTKTVLNMAERNFEAEGVDMRFRKKLFNVMMESLQNIGKHQSRFISEDGNRESAGAILLVALQDQQYKITTGNLISNAGIRQLKFKLDYINAQDKEGLKVMYKEARLNSTISDVGGAGLGFIDIARKSGNKICYHFEKIDDQHSFVAIEARIDLNESEDE